MHVRAAFDDNIFFQSLFKITNLSLQHVNVYLGNSRKDRFVRSLVPFVANLPRAYFVLVACVTTGLLGY